MKRRKFMDSLLRGKFLNVRKLVVQNSPFLLLTQALQREKFLNEILAEISDMVIPGKSRLVEIQKFVL